ncbi:hypothetical protein [Streptacidiphilus albus]|nr:hypothetical protein [Streptacidiphilus albus]
MDLALREAALKAELAAVQLHVTAAKARYEAARGRVQAAMDDETQRGVTAFGAVMPSGQVVAKVVLTNPDPAPRITDERAWIDWVRDTYPTVHTTRFVREVSPAWQSGLFKAMQKSGKAIDPATGEIVPGVEIPDERQRGHRLTFTADGEDAITQAFRAGLMTPDVLPALLAPPESDEA